MINREKTRLYKDLFNLIFSIVDAENISENGKDFYAALQQYDQLARATTTFMAIDKAQFTWDVDNIKQEYEKLFAVPERMRNVMIQILRPLLNLFARAKKKLVKIQRIIIWTLVIAAL